MRDCSRRQIRSRALLAIGVAAILSAAGELAAQSRSIHFDRLSIEHGLSQGTVTCVLQDRVGFLWLGTQDGLNRYDGYGFEVYKHDPVDPGSLPHDSILALAEDASGDLWIGTEGGGLARWRRETDAFERYRHDPDDPASLGSDRVRAIYFDRLGAMWVGSDDAGLARFDPESGHFEHFRHRPDDPASLADDRIRTLYEDRIGNLWVGTLGGLHLLDRSTGRFLRFRHDPDDPASLSDDRVRSILENYRGELWIGTYRGLNRLERSTASFRRYLHDPADPGSLSEDRVRTLFEDDERRMWVGTDGGLDLYQASSDSFLHYRHDPSDPRSLSSQRVMSIHQDRGGILWIGTQGAGLNKWNPRTWSFAHYKSASGVSEGLSSNAVFALSMDGAGRVWIGTLGGGLDVFDRASGKVIRHRHDPLDPGSLSDDRVTALLQDRQGRMWIGTLAGGLNRFEETSGRFVHYRHDPAAAEGLAHDGVAALHQDRRDRLWIGTFGGGLSRLDPESGDWRSFCHVPGDLSSLGDDRVTSFAESPAGELWVGTEGGGLHLFDDSNETFLRIEQGSRQRGDSRGNAVRALHVDDEGTLWVGTQGGGLDRLVGLDRRTGQASFRNLSERNGLPNDVIHGILSDDRGHLWLSTNKGLSRLDPRTGAIQSYGAGHGLQSNEFNFGAHYRSPSGELFFGGVNGFNAFFPERIESNDRPPPIVLTRFLKHSQPVDLGRSPEAVAEVTLHHRDDVVSFEFAALDFTAPEKNRYAYHLEGMNDDWIELGSYRRATFTTLDPGSYVLRVRAANSDGAWNEAGLTLPIRVQPPPWRSPWAYTLYALAGLAAVSLSVSSRRRKRRRGETLQRARETVEAAEAASRAKGEFLANMSHEIRTPMNGVVGMTSLLLETSLTAKQRQYLETIRVSSESLLTILNDILDFSKIESRRLELESCPFDLRTVVEEALELLTPSAAKKGLDLAYRFEEGTPEAITGDPTRVRQVLVNLISNGIKFTESGEVFVTVSAPDGDPLRIFFEVADTGIGIPEERIDRLFQPFSQIDASTTRRYGGTGLGLAICKRLCELMGGDVQVESRPGQGSVFRFHILAEKASGPERAHLHRAQPFLVDEKLLAIGESHTIRLLASYAERWGMAVERAKSSAAAAARLRAGETFRMAVVDSRLGSGVEEVLEAADACRSRELPLILLCPLGDVEGLLGGPTPSAIVSKPLKPTELLEVLIAVATESSEAVVRTGAAEPRAAGSRHPLRILLAEDNVVNQKVALLLLERLGYRADVVADGREALEALDRQPYDVVLMDLQMPEMDGFEAARHIRELDAERRPTVIAITAHAIKGDRERCLAAGMDDYLSKPIRIEELGSALQRVPPRPKADAAQADLAHCAGS